MEYNYLSYIYTFTKVLSLIIQGHVGLSQTVRLISLSFFLPFPPNLIIFGLPPMDVNTLSIYLSIIKNTCIHTHTYLVCEVGLHPYVSTIKTCAYTHTYLMGLPSYLSINLSVCLSVCLSVYLYIHLPIYLSIYLPIYHKKLMYIHTHIPGL